MSDFDPTLFAEELNACAESFGGKNHFLKLLEALREANPHPLISKHSIFRCDVGYIKWNKVIFNDKLLLLKKIRTEKSEDGNLLTGNKKNVINLVRTLKPLEFTVNPKNKKEGEGFTLSPFEIIDEQTTKINPLFDAIFFAPVHSVKKAMKQTIKEA